MANVCDVCGKKPMTGEEFQRGAKLTAGDKLS